MQQFRVQFQQAAVESRHRFELANGSRLKLRICRQCGRRLYRLAFIGRPRPTDYCRAFAQFVEGREQEFFLDVFYGGRGGQFIIRQGSTDTVRSCRSCMAREVFDCQSTDDCHNHPGLGSELSWTDIKAQAVFNTELGLPSRTYVYGDGWWLDYRNELALWRFSIESRRYLPPILIGARRRHGGYRVCFPAPVWRVRDLQLWLAEIESWIRRRANQFQLIPIRIRLRKPVLSVRATTDHRYLERRLVPPILQPLGRLSPLRQRLWERACRRFGLRRLRLTDGMGWAPPRRFLSSRIDLLYGTVIIERPSI